MATLKEILQQIGARHGVEQLNPMQRAVADARANRIVLLAPTGSGKTLAFTVPMLSRLSSDADGVQAVVIAPSRELVIQIADVIRPVATGFKTVALYGGHKMEEEVKSLTVTPDIVVATPGRLLDHLLRGTIDLSHTPNVVLDEYDKSLELGFHDQMRRIIKRMPAVKYVMLTSATPLAEMPDFIDLSQAKVLDFSAKAQSPRAKMTIARVNSDSRDKLEALAGLLNALPNGKTLVFVNHRESAERVFEYLKRHDFPAGLYHGGLDQLRREIAIDMLNNGSTPILVSTDLGSRGLDIEDVRSVIHYHLPPTVEAWTHRNGRTARLGGGEGYIYLLVNEADRIPEYIDYDEIFVPEADNPDPIRSNTATIYFNGGKKEKISKGDILGFLTKQCGIAGGQVGKIIVKDHAVLAAVPASAVDSVIATARSTKIKNQRLRATLL